MYDPVAQRPLLTPWNELHDEETGDQHSPRDEEDMRWLTATPRRKMRRADVACLMVVTLVAGFVAIWQPQVRPENPIWGHRHEVMAASEAVEPAASFQYMTYDDINATQREHGYSVTYTTRGFEIDGRGSLLLGGSIHYPRSTPSMWEDLLWKAKHDGLNHIELYIFWNLHEPTRDTFTLEERANVTQFYELAARVGLFLHVRFGPYACAEWNNGGLPLWLDTIPGMNVRSSTVPWQREMERFVTRMVTLSRPYLASNGGPIIMAQIENEFTGDDAAYVDWCGTLVETLNTTIPWVMCNGKAANNTILACNGNDCVQFADEQIKTRPLEPFMWTEDEGWYQKWARKPEDMPEPNEANRAASEVAYAVARWFAVGGAHHNYYMYHGGNNYGRSASAGVTTMYADGVNLHSDGLSNEPKRSHLRMLHNALIGCNEILLRDKKQINNARPLTGASHQVYIYGNPTTFGQVAFLENSDLQDAAIVAFNGSTYRMAPQSMVIVKDNQVLFDTADVQHSYPHSPYRVYSPVVQASSLSWESWTDHADTRKTIVNKHPLEQLGITLDESDYLTYQTQFELETFVRSDPNSDLVTSIPLTFTGCDANAYVVVVNDQYVDDVFLAYPGENCTRVFEVKIPLDILGEVEDARNKKHLLTVISVSLGLFSLGKRHHKGIMGDVFLPNGQSLMKDSEWKMFPGLIGEELHIYEPRWSASVPWIPVNRDAKTMPRMTWSRTRFYISGSPGLVRGYEFPMSEATSSLLLDCVGLTRGRAYINGHDLGRYWLLANETGAYVQRHYHLPVDWLHFEPEQANELVVFDELGGSTRDVSVVLSTIVDGAEDAIAALEMESPSVTYTGNSIDITAVQ